MIYTPIGMYILTYHKRKNLLLIGTLVSWVSSWIAFQASSYIVTTEFVILMFNGFANIVSGIWIFVFTFSFWLTTASTIYVYWGETLTDKGMAWATAFHWFANALIEFFPIFAFMLVEWRGSYILFHDANSIFFFIFSGNSILGFFLVTIFVKETFGKNQSEISEAFGKSNYYSLSETVSSKSSNNF